MLLRSTKQDLHDNVEVKRFTDNKSFSKIFKTCLCDITSDEIILIKNEKFVSEEPALVKFSANVLLTL